ncbi:Protein MIS12 like protein [Willisornis vidua]|uniref:Protein MIS12 homolog n=1 Tax=Willisornis vidua TaxID=1566151 RepID=A0ABQ9DXX8_9PASS|nr:Protein MIS12 like protein [Willisornis vidua]
MSVNPMAYEAQFFGFTPQTCMLRIYLAFQDYLFEVMQVVEGVILKKLEEMPGCTVSPSEIRKCTEEFLIFMKDRFDKLFGKMEEVLLQLVLSIPKNVLLPEDKVHEEFPYSQEEFQALQEEIRQLELQCRAEAAAEQALRAELEEQKVVKAELEKILQWFDDVKKIFREQGIGNLKESLTFLKESAEKLQVVMKEVEEKGKELKMRDELM